MDLTFQTIPVQTSNSWVPSQSIEPEIHHHGNTMQRASQVPVHVAPREE